MFVEKYENFCRYMEEVTTKSLKDLNLQNYGKDVKNKVNPQGNFLPYYGDTTVFPLKKEDSNRLHKIQKEIYQEIGHLLSKPLKPSSFHITLHDLTHGPSLQKIENQILTNQKKCRYVFSNKFGSKLFACKSINFHLKNIYPMNNTSIVIEAIPTHESFYVLAKMYEEIDSIVKIETPYIPHITLFYFKPTPLSYESSKAILSLLKRINKNKKDIPISVDVGSLAYQHFTDMNHYKTIFTIESLALRYYENNNT